MKKIILFLTFLSLTGAAYAAEDLYSIYDDYNEAQFSKIISDKDYKNAIKAVESYKKPNKKLEKKFKNTKLDTHKNQNAPKFMLNTPASSKSLLTLPVDINHNGELIQKGFYLVDPIYKDGEHFIRLTRGEGKIIADIEANLFKTDNMNKISENKQTLKSEIIQNELFKITYSNKEMILEAYLFIQ